MPLVLARLLTIVVALAAVGSTGAASSSGSAPLQTGLFDPASFESNPALSFARTRAAGAGSARLILEWRAAVPREPTRPVGFDAANPDDPAYDWSSFDRQVRPALSAGLEPIAILFLAPRWAEGANGGSGIDRPDPDELGMFAQAAAKRYDGRAGRPRVRHWQVWNEPNISLYMTPQFVNGKPFSPGHYRKMVNAVAGAVKTVRADNLVVAGGTAPFRDITPEVVKVNPRWGPLTFMREFLCLSRALKPTCSEKVRFDAWAHHPYTSGGPTHHAVLPDDVSLGDLPEMRKVLDAGSRTRHITSRGPVQFWVTEFGWDTKGPDPRGVPLALHARWVSEGLYRMWKSGVSLVTWFQVRDDSLKDSFYQSGLWFRGATPAADRPKPALRAFRFPVVAIPESRGVRVWGRTPFGRAGRLVVEQSFRGGWKVLGRLSADRNGIFERVFATSPVGSVRARLSSGELSIPFAVPPVPDQAFNPFGQETLLEPKRKR